MLTNRLPKKSRIMLSRLFLLTCAVFLLVVLSACTDPNDDYLQGRWARGDVHFWDEWVFDRGAFTHQVHIDVTAGNANQSGYYRLVESDGDTLVLELFNTQGRSSIEEQDLLRIVFNREEDSARIQGATYYRVGSPTLEEVATLQAPPNSQ